MQDGRVDGEMWRLGWQAGETEKMEGGRKSKESSFVVTLHPHE